MQFGLFLNGAIDWGHEKYLLPYHRSNSPFRYATRSAMHALFFPRLCRGGQGGGGGELRVHESGGRGAND